MLVCDTLLSVSRHSVMVLPLSVFSLLVELTFLVSGLQVHSNAAQSLCDIVKLGREQLVLQHDAPEPDPLLSKMEW